MSAPACCYGTDSILSDANSNWVSAELAYWGDGYAMLRARASSIGAWEQYSLVCNTNGSLSIRSNANGLYVSAELGYGGSSGDRRFSAIAPGTLCPSFAGD